MKWTLLLILLLLIPAASAVNYPAFRGYVTDNANMIDQSYEEKITQLAGDIERETTVQIAVVTVESLEGETLEMYAVNLFKNWGIGKKDKDNGLLIIVAKDSHDYGFEVGYGLEGTVTDITTFNIGKKIIEPNFKNGDYGKGIYESILVVQGLVKGNPEVVSQYGMEQNGQEGSMNGTEVIPVLYNILIFLIILFVIFIFVMNIAYSSETSWRRRHGYRNPPVVIPDFGWRMGGGGFGGGGFGGGFGGGRSGGGGFGGGFGGFGGGRSGGGGFKGKW